MQQAQVQLLTVDHSNSKYFTVLHSLTMNTAHAFLVAVCAGQYSLHALL